MTYSRIALCCAAAIGVMSPIARAADRIVTTLDSNWTFDGRAVSVPHTWNAIDAADGEGDFAGCVSAAALKKSYARGAHLYATRLAAAKKGRRYFIRLEGAAVKSVIKVNGREIGRHDNGYTAYCCEATAAMTADAENRLEIIVDNTWDAHTVPFFGDFSVQGGLYRPVKLIETDMVCIDPTRYGGPGFRLWPDAKTGKVKVDVAVNGGADFTREYDFGKVELWSPENPKLYSLTVALDTGDSVTGKFGFRTVEFRDDGFYLNGVKRKLRGVNRHQDRDGKGYAVSAADEWEDVRIVKGMGADAVRTSHYPQSRAYMDACDAEGLLVWYEAANVNFMTFDDEFKAALLEHVREIVAQNANRPSVIMWSLFNELTFDLKRRETSANRPPMPPEKVLEFLYAENDEFHRLDPTRPTTGASNNPAYAQMNQLADVLAYNLYAGWYEWAPWYTLDVKSAGESYRRSLAAAPLRKGFILSEYGAGGCVTQHADAGSSRPNGNGFYPEEYEASLHAETCRAAFADDHIWGTFAWQMFDSAADCRREGERYGLNNKGLVSYDRRVFKDAYWFYKANWSKEPVLHLVGERMTRTGTKAATVLVFSNLPEVELFVNGERIGTRKPDEVKCVRWENVALKAGVNRIEVRSGNERRIANWKLVPPDFPVIGKPRAITSGPKDHFLARSVDWFNAETHQISMWNTTSFTVKALMRTADEACLPIGSFSCQWRAAEARGAAICTRDGAPTESSSPSMRCTKVLAKFM